MTPSPGTLLTSDYDPQLVLLSVVIAVVVSYTALALAGRVSDSAGRARRLWLLAGAATMGFGIWSMHFIGMLALRIPVAVSYDIPLTLISILPATLAALLALQMVGQGPLTWQRRGVGALAMGGGVSLMHYTGMGALDLPATIHYHLPLSIASFLLATAAAWVALGFVHHLHRHTFRGLDWRLAAGAGAMGIGISGTHYADVAAAQFIATSNALHLDGGFNPTALALVISTITLLIVAITLLASFFDRRLALQNLLHARLLARTNSALERKVHERTTELKRANEALQADIFARQQAEEALATEKERAEVTLHSIADAVITTRADGVVEYLNPAAERLLGWSASAARGHHLREIYRVVEAESRLPLEEPAGRCLRERAGIYSSEPQLLLARGGSELFIEDSAAPIRHRNDTIVGVVVVFRDVTERRQLAQQLNYQSTHDALTGLINRQEFERRLAGALERLRVDGNGQHALLYLDLDQFKVVNDTCGHIAGDELLRQLSYVLSSQIRDSDSLARLGGDEFGVLLMDCPEGKARELAELMRQAINGHRFSWGEQSFELGVSIGMVAVDRFSPDTGDLLSAADVACYTAKDTGRNRVHSYQPDDTDLAQRHSQMHWISRIHRALQGDRFRLHLQSILPIGRHTGPLHFEVLIRLEGEDGTLIPPGAFIPAAERYSLMGSIDRWVVRHTFAEIAHHCSVRRTARSCVFAINLSGASLSDDSLLDFIEGQLSEFSVSPAAICFEITETAAIGNLARASRFLKHLKRIGCRFALDDFGSGLSSFAYLKNLPVDYLKIDGAFVRGLPREPMDRTIVEAIVRVGRVLGIETVAEFVETEEQLRALKEIGVDFAQGYLIDQPRSLETVLLEIDRPRAVTE